LLSKHAITVTIHHGADKKTYRFNMHKIPSFTSLWLVMAGGFETLADYFRSLTDEQLEEALNTHAGRLYPMPSTRHSRAQMHIALAEAQRRSLAPIKSMDFICGEAA
jgi:hypothetical protein